VSYEDLRVPDVVARRTELAGQGFELGSGTGRDRGSGGNSARHNRVKLLLLFGFVRLW